MADRHSLSEPRICPTSTENDLSWEVDVYRENVTDPIDTLRINDSTLPPRTRKGKVVWRLPTEYGKLPSFGNDERRRIMDLFKERKKNRRKKKQSSASSVSSSGRTRSMSSLVSDEEKDDLNVTRASSSPKGKNETSSKSFTSGSGGGPPETVSTKDSPTKHLKKQMSAMSVGDSSSHSKPVTPPRPKTKSTASPTTTTPPHGLEPPGLPSSSHTLSPPSPENVPQDPPPPETPPPKPQLPTRRCIVVPKDSPVTPTAAAAKAFISLYYPSVTHGLTADLCSYYHADAQKSISVGGAHAVVIGLDNIALQITSLAGCLFNVRGVVAQDAAQNGAHLLMTGVCTPKGGFVTAFAHSVGLARVEMGDGTGFVIQNDALSLLSGEMTLAVEQQQQKQQEQQQREQQVFQQQQHQHHHHLHHDYGMSQENNARDQASTYAEQHHQPSFLRPPGLFG